MCNADTYRCIPNHKNDRTIQIKKIHWYIDMNNILNICICMCICICVLCDSMCICVYMYMCLCEYVYCICVNVYVCICVHVCMRTCVYVHMCIYMKYTCMPYIYIYINSVNAHCILTNKSSEAYTIVYAAVNFKSKECQEQWVLTAMNGACRVIIVKRLSKAINIKRNDCQQHCVSTCVNSNGCHRNDCQEQ